MQRRFFLFSALVFMLFPGSFTVATGPQPVVTLTPVVSSAPNTTQPFKTPGTSTSQKIPVTWSALHLSGKLIYSVSASDANANLVMQVQHNLALFLLDLLEQCDRLTGS